MSPPTGGQLPTKEEPWSSYAMPRDRHGKLLFKCFPVSSDVRTRLPVSLEGFNRLGQWTSGRGCVQKGTEALFGRHPRRACCET